MAENDDPEILAYKDTLIRGLELKDCVVLETQPQDFCWEELGCDPREFVEEAVRYVQRGGEVDKQKEERHPWCRYHEFHYDLRFSWSGYPELYVETRLIQKRDPYFNTIQIVKLKYRDEKLNRKCKVRT